MSIHLTEFMTPVVYHAQAAAPVHPWDDCVNLPKRFCRNNSCCCRNGKQMASKWQANWATTIETNAPIAPLNTHCHHMLDVHLQPGVQSWTKTSIIFIYSFTHVLPSKAFHPVSMWSHCVGCGEINLKHIGYVFVKAFKFDWKQVQACQTMSNTTIQYYTYGRYIYIYYSTSQKQRQGSKAFKSSAADAWGTTQQSRGASARLLMRKP